MGQIRADRLIKYALNVLIEAVMAADRDDSGAIIPRSWGVRLALAYLHHRGIGTAEDHQRFWHGMVDPHEGQPGTMGGYLRFRELSKLAEHFHKRAGEPYQDYIPTIRNAPEPPPPPPSPRQQAMDEFFSRQPPLNTPEHFHWLKEARERFEQPSTAPRTTHPRHRSKKSTIVKEGSRRRE